MYEFKKKIQLDKKLKLITYQNKEALKRNINPFDQPAVEKVKILTKNFLNSKKF